MAASMHAIVGRRFGVLFHKKINQRGQLSARINVSLSGNKYSYDFTADTAKTLTFSTLQANKIEGGLSLSTNVKSNHGLDCSKLYPVRYFSLNNPPDSSKSDGDESNKRPLHLMDFPKIMWPSLIYSMKNWILSKVIIRQYLDSDFDLDVFASGAKQAFLFVSSLLMQGKVEELKDLVTKDAFEEIKRNYSLLSLQQRQLFSIVPADVYFTYPYQVGIMFDDSTNTQKRFVEITMCFHCIPGAAELAKNGHIMQELHKRRDKLVVGNCRFIKEFTKGCESDWTINILNYYRPMELFT